ncbi:MAG: acyl carrier protein [Clostridia bacterium]|nr:acyl carrier protein [Clostridia bacterium]
MKEKLLTILRELRSDVDFENETALVTDGILDSFDIVSLVAEINSEFDITIGVDDLEPENFDTVDAMAALISELAD